MVETCEDVTEMTDLLISALLYLDHSNNPKVQEIVKQIQLIDMTEDCDFRNPSKLQDHQDQVKCFEEREK